LLPLLVTRNIQPGDEIYSDATSLVGSVGVIMAKYNLTALLKKHKINSNTVSSNE
jgi:ClpP class serine protease